MIQVQNLHFGYRRKKIFTGLNLQLEAGHIYGLLGKNGTGKSTLLKNMAGLLFPEKGTVNVLGFTPAKRQPAFLRDIFMVPEEFFLPDVAIEHMLKHNAPFYPRFNDDQFNREELTTMSSLELPAVRFISIKGLGNCGVMAGNKPKLEIQKENAGGLAYRVVNDTLYIMGDSANTMGDLQRRSRNNNLVNVYLPGTVQIEAAYSSLRVGGAADSDNAPSYNVRLEDGSYLFIKRSHDKSTVYFNQLTIHSEGSNIELDNHVFINDLNLQLIGSKIEDKEAGIRSLTMDADSHSTVTLSGNNIKALK